MREPKGDAIVTRATLIGRLKNWEDQTSWREFDRTYRRLIIAFAVNQGLSESEAQDVAQETLLAVAKDIGKFEYDRGRSTFKNWLLTVTRHRITDYIRRRPEEPKLRPRRGDETTHTSTTARLPDPNSVASDAVWDEEWRRTVLEQALERLKTEVRTQHFQIFYLSIIKEQSGAKVATALGVNVATVYVVRHRLARRFKKIVAALRDAIG